MGIASIAACRSTQLAHILLTDGNADVVAIARQNLVSAGLCSPDTSTAHSSTGDLGRASAQTYSWGDPRPVVSPSQPDAAASEGFDVLLGSELCYYNTDMTLLVATAQRLLSKEHGEEGGIFVHAHIFRKPDQEEEMIECFDAIHWATAEVGASM